MADLDQHDSRHDSKPDNITAGPTSTGTGVGSTCPPTYLPSDPLAFIKNTGVIKSVRPDRGYAFLTDTQGEDRFFHRSSMNNPADFDVLLPGVYVFFTPIKHAKGPRATRVHLVA